MEKNKNQIQKVNPMVPKQDKNEDLHLPSDPIDKWLEIYKEFKSKCWRHGLTNKEEIVLLYNIF